MSWHLLGHPSPDTLTEARLQLHYAAQVVAALGFTHVAPRNDWSHTSFQCLARLTSLISEPATFGDRTLHTALRFPDLAMLVLDADQSILAARPLDGLTLDEGYAWLRETLATHAGVDAPLTRPAHEMPDHPLAHGARFACPDPAPFAELARWYDNADRLLRPFFAAMPDAPPVRCWPHHFDFATLITLDSPDVDPEHARSIGAGLSPGDGSYAEPYWYVLPWPPPPTDSLPPLEGGGHWHTDGWVGATLPATTHVQTQVASEQHLQGLAFMTSAIAAARDLTRAAANTPTANSQ